MNDSCGCVRMHGDLLCLCDDHQIYVRTMLRKGIALGANEEMHRILTLIAAASKDFEAHSTEAYALNALYKQVRG